MASDVSGGGEDLSNLHELADVDTEDELEEMQRAEGEGGEW